MAENNENMIPETEDIIEEPVAEETVKAVEDTFEETAEAAVEKEDEALSSFLSREQEDKKPAKKSKLNKKIVIPIIIAVAVVALAVLLIVLKSQPLRSTTDPDSLLPADITTDVNDKGEHEAKVTKDENGEIKHNGNGSLLTYVPADIKKIDVENENGSFSVLSDTPEGEATVYTLVGYEDVGLQSGIADEVANAVSTVEFSKVVSADGNLADFGLEKPRAIATVSYNDDTTAVLKIGNEAAGGVGTYISMGSGKAVYLTDTDKVAPLLYGVNQLISLDITDTMEDSENSEFSTLTVTGSRYPEDITIVPNKDEAIDAVYLVTEPRKMFANAVESYDIAGSIRGLYAEEVVCVHPSSGQLEDYGIADPYAKVTASYPDTNITLSCSAPGEQGIVNIYNPDKDIIYTIQQSAVSWACTSVEALTPEQIINAKINAVSKVQFSGGGKDYTFKVATKTETVDTEDGDTEDVVTTTATYDGKELSSDNFTVFFQNLNGIKNMGDAGSGGSQVMRFIFSYDNGRAADVVTAYDIGEAQYAIVMNEQLVGSASKSYIDSLISDAEALVKGEDITSH